MLLCCIILSFFYNCICELQNLSVTAKECLLRFTALPLGSTEESKSMVQPVGNDVAHLHTYEEERLVLGQKVFCQVVQTAVGAVLSTEGEHKSSADKARKALAAVPVALQAAIDAQLHKDKVASLKDRRAQLMEDYVSCRMTAFEEKVCFYL